MVTHGKLLPPIEMDLDHPATFTDLLLSPFAVVNPEPHASETVASLEVTFTSVPHQGLQVSNFQTRDRFFSLGS